MSIKSIVSIVGARPQFIKASVLSRALRRRADCREVLVHTGQHYDDRMSQIFFEELEIPEPKYNLAIGSGPHGQQTGRMLEALESVLQRESPDWVVVFGDTNSTLAGALAAAKLHLPVAHVEAGLRSFNRRMPEEINRVVADHLSDLLLVPTPTAVAQLEHEGIPPERIRLVGDVMYDAALFCAEKAATESKILSRLSLTPQGFILATVHRAESTDDPERLSAILLGLAEVGRELPVVLPLHPRTKHAIDSQDGLRGALGAIQIVEPVGYVDMVNLIRNARLIATDSGGLQKEAYFFRVPCVTLRTETEWVELVEHGWNRLAPLTAASAVAAALHAAMGSRGQEVALYGGGHAGDQICQILIDTPAPNRTHAS